VPQALHESLRFPATQDKLVQVDLGSCDVEARVEGQDTIRVEIDLEVRASSAAAARRWLERHKPELEDSEKTLLIRTPKGRPALYLASFRQTRAIVRVTLPSRCRLEVSTASGDVRLSGETLLSGPVRVTTTSGDVRVDGGGGDLIVHTASGDCEITGPPVTSLQFDSGSGDLRLRGGASRVISDTSSGDVIADALVGSMSAHSSSGDVKATWQRLAPGDTVGIETTSGDVTLRLPAGARLRGELQTSSGDLRCEFESTCRHHECVLNATDPANELKVTTSSGDIGVRASAASELQGEHPQPPPASPAPTAAPLPEAPARPGP
jgi:hypothetical protein